jgi:hypothetical protein
MSIFLLLTVIIINPILGKYTPTWDSIDSRPLPEWYDQAKIGMYESESIKSTIVKIILYSIFYQDSFTGPFGLVIKNYLLKLNLAIFFLSTSGWI